jgi:chromosome segregation ATPase
MKRKDNQDVIKTFHRLTNAAEAYVSRSPRVKRIQEQRSALVDAIADAQLILSVHQLPKESVSERSSSKAHKAPTLEKEMKTLRDKLKAIDRSLRPVSSELEALQQRAEKARMLLNSALAKHGSKDDTAKDENDDAKNPS